MTMMQRARCVRRKVNVRRRGCRPITDADPASAADDVIDDAQTVAGATGEWVFNVCLQSSRLADVSVFHRGVVCSILLSLHRHIFGYAKGSMLASSGDVPSNPCVVDFVIVASLGRHIAPRLSVRPSVRSVPPICSK